MTPYRGQRSHASSEEQRLLPLASDQQSMKYNRTPLPFFQLSILLYIKFCEASATNVVEPFMNERLLSFADGDQGTAAYLASVMDASLYAVSLTTVLYWNRLSDTVGRKPIMILGMTAITVSISFVGLATTFWAFVVSRCISSAFDQTRVVMRCAVDEMTDESNNADAFSLLIVPWSLGMLIGPLVGGYLSNPHTRFPKIFVGRFWEQHPYLLPCTAIALITLPGLLTLRIWFRETLPSRFSHIRHRDDEIAGTCREQIPLRSLLIPRVLLTTANNIGLAFLYAAFATVYPLFLAMSPSVGGLGLPTWQIGLILSARGLFGSVAQALLLGPAVRRFGLGRVFIIAMSSYIPIFFLFPLMNIYAKDALTNSNPTSCNMMWMLLILHVMLIVVVESGYACMCMYIVAAAPNGRSLGAVNGLTETSDKGAQLAGSASSAFMLGMSIKRGWMGGHAVYVLFGIIAYGGVVLARKLPRHTKEWSEEMLE